MLTYRFRCYPTIEQIEKITKIDNALKSIFNQMLYNMIENYKSKNELNKNGVKVLNGGKVIEIMALEQNAWIKEEKMPMQVFHNMVFYEFDSCKNNYIKKNYKKYKENALEFNPKSEFGVPRFKKKNDTMSICYSNPKTAIVNKRVYLPKIGYVKLVEHRELEGKIKEIRLSKDTVGNFYLSIRTDHVSDETNLNLKNSDANKICGIDFGLKQWITLSDGTVYECPSFYRDEEEKIEGINKEISKLFECEIARRKAIFKKLKEQFPNEDDKKLKKQAEKKAESKRLKKLRKEVSVIQLKIANRRKAYIQNTVVDIFKKYPIVIIPNLYVKELQSVSESRVKDKNINKKFNDASLGMLKETFINVAKREGYICKLAVKSYPFSKTCSNCGVLNKDINTTISEIWECPDCKNKNNVFINSAINLKNLYLNNINDLLVDDPTDDKSYKKSLKKMEEEKQAQRDANNPNLKKE